MTFSEFFSTYFGLSGITPEAILRAVILLAVCLIVVKLLLKAADRALRRIDIEPSLHSFLRTAIKMLLLFLAILIVAGSLNIPMSSLIAVLSVAGLAVSLAVQKTLSNVAGGLQILISRPYLVGNYIEAGGVSGTVMDIGVVYTKMKTPDNKVIFVPNSEISAAKIINYSREENRRVDLTFAVSYEAPVDLVKETIAKTVSEHSQILFTPEPLIRVNAYLESSIEYAVQVWCGASDCTEVRFDLLEQVKAAFDRAGIRMTYNQLNVHIIQGTSEDTGG